MPVTISAKKKLRQDRKRRIQNLLIKKSVKRAITTFKHSPSIDFLSKVFSILDNAKKNKIFHSNKVARLRSRLSRLLSKSRDNKEKTSSTKNKSSKKKKSVV